MKCEGHKPDGNGYCVTCGDPANPKMTPEDLSGIRYAYEHSIPGGRRMSEPKMLTVEAMTRLKKHHTSVHGLLNECYLCVCLSHIDALEQELKNRDQIIRDGDEDRAELERQLSERDKQVEELGGEAGRSTYSLIAELRTRIATLMLTVDARDKAIDGLSKLSESYIIQNRELHHTIARLREAREALDGREGE